MKTALAILCVGLVGTLPSLAGAELHTVDGKILTGASVERREGLYLLVLDSGETLTVPVALVRELKLTGDDTPAVGGVVETEPETLSGPEPASANPPLVDRYRVLAPGRSRFPQDVIVPDWQPQPNLGLGGDVSQFAPSRWPQSVIDPVWAPRSVFDTGNDVTRFRPASWAGGWYDFTWRPTDGFAASTDQGR